MSRGRISNPKAPGTADLLVYAALIDDGLVLCKDGSLLAGFFFRGPDQESATPEERNYLTARVNAALSRLGSGFALRVDAVRLPSAAYPEPSASHFPETLSRAIDEERRRHFLSEGAHFESEHALLIQCTPPIRRKSRIADLVYSDSVTGLDGGSTTGLKRKAKAGAQPKAASPGDAHIRNFSFSTRRSKSFLCISVSRILILARSRRAATMRSIVTTNLAFAEWPVPRPTWISRMPYLISQLSFGAQNINISHA